MPAAPSYRPPIFTPVDFVPLGDGTFRAIPRKPVELAPAALASKMTGMPLKGLYQLYHAGFIDGTQATPRKILLNMASLLAHIEASKEPEFWTRERISRFETGSRH